MPRDGAVALTDGSPGGRDDRRWTDQGRGTSYNSFSEAVDVAKPDESGVITYEISGKVDVTDTGWVQVAKAGLTDLSKVAFVGITDDAEICITGDLAILADQKYDIDVSFTNLKLSKPNPTYGGDYGHSTNYFTCWLRNTGAAENTVTYTNCTFPNGVCNNQYGKTVFNNCKFTNNTAGLSNLWNYGGETKVEECTFTGTRGIKMYNEGTLQNPPSIEIKNTNFTGMTEKAAIVVSKAANVTLNTVGATDCTMGLLQKDIEGSTDEQKVTIEANGTGISGDFNITAQKDAEAAKNEFNISGGEFTSEVKQDYCEDAFEVKASADGKYTVVRSEYVAKVGGIGYTTLEAAFKELNAKNHTLTLIDGSAWSTSTPVYWKTNGQWTAVAKLTDALTAAYKAGPSDEITIVCRPGADVGEMTHGHVADNLTIYGNNAYLSGGECDLEVDTYQFSRETGAQANDGVTLDKKITITAYELDNLGVWGERHTNYNVNVVLTDCDGNDKVVPNVQRVYISGTTGENNIMLIGCDFLTKATAVYSNADGDVTIKSCSFTGSQVPVNINHKADGTQTVMVMNSTFTACGDEGEWKQFAAPIRFVNSGNGTMSANVSDCTITDTKGANGDILLGDGRTGQKSNNLELTVSGTAANVQAQQPGYYAENGTDAGKVSKTIVTESQTRTITNSSNAADVEGTKYDTLQAAINAADGKTVKLLKNVTEAVTIPVGKTITLDLNGFTLVNNATAQNNAAADRKHTITNNGTLTIKDSVGGGIVDNVSHGRAAIKNNVGGTVTIENGTFCRTAEASIDADNSGNNSYYVIDNQGTMNINGGTFKFSDTKNGAYSSLIHNGWYDGTKNTEKAPAKMTITDGSFTQGTGGKITVKNDDYGELKIQGGTFTQPQAGYYCVFNWNVAEITGGTINGPVGCGGNESIEADKGQLAIGGTAHINGELQKDTSSGEPSISVSGGTFSSAVKPEYCAPGFVPKANSDGTYGVTRPSSGSSSYDPTYSVSTPSKTKNGSVTVSPKNASKGDTVTVTVKPDSGYVLETLTVTDKNGNELTLKDKGNGKYTFIMPAGKVEVKATFMEDNSMLNFFYDVPNNAYFYEAVKWAVKNGITTGVGNDLFAPEQPCTRAQIVTFLWRAAGSPEPKGAASGMTDVVSGSYYEKAVAWAIENGITTGTTTSTFSPDATCTRAQAVTFLARALKAKAASAAEFSDVPTGSYFADAVAWAAANGVTEGIGGGLFGSDNDCTRGQIVTFLYRAYNK